MKDLRDISLYLLDMDGTIYLGDRVFECTLPFLSLLKEQGKHYIFLTNNCTRNRYAYFDRLQSMGIPVESDGVFTLEEEFREAGFVLTDKEIDYVVLGFDTELTYEKLRKLCDFVRYGAPFIATHPDFNWPTDGGFIPDVGSMLALVEASTGRRPDYIVGKPNRGIIDALCDKYGLRHEDIAMVGDRLYTDIAVGVNAGITSILVLSGESTLADLKRSDVKPDYVFHDLSGITNTIR